MIYSIDTNSIIAAWVEHYPKDTFPAVWKRLDALAQTGRLLASPFVHEELERQDDGAAEWCKQSGILVPVDEDVQRTMAALLAKHPRLVDDIKGRSQADPWIIALAQVRRATVVTQENASNSTNRPKIPDVCLALNVPCMKILELFRAERWVI